MNLKKTIVSLIVGSLLAVGGLFAAEAAKEAKAAACCTKATKDGKACDHPCCVTAAKAGNNCEKCNGVGKVADNKKDTPPPKK